MQTHLGSFQKHGFCDRTDLSSCDRQGDAGEDVGVVALPGVERFAVQRDRIERRAAGKDTSALKRDLVENFQI